MKFVLLLLGIAMFICVLVPLHFVMRRAMRLEMRLSERYATRLLRERGVLEP